MPLFTRGEIMINKAEDWESLNQEILKCQKCPLSKARTQAVPGVGPHDAQLVIIGEAPGRQEDIQGQPFVGAAGQLLTKLLEDAGIKREAVFISNVVKCRPPENRQPTASEREACHLFLVRQLNHIQPKIIALVGRVPAETLLEKSVNLGAMHGKTYARDRWTFFVMYHPAAGLYNQNILPVMEEDMQKLRRLIDERPNQAEPSVKGQRSLSHFFSDQQEG